MEAEHFDQILAAYDPAVAIFNRSLNALRRRKRLILEQLKVEEDEVRYMLLVHSLKRVKRDALL
jgi:hypothetical protein